MAAKGVPVDCPKIMIIGVGFFKKRCTVKTINIDPYIKTKIKNTEKFKQCHKNTNHYLP